MNDHLIHTLQTDHTWIIYAALGLAGYKARQLTQLTRDNAFSKHPLSLLLIGMPVSVLTALASEPLTMTQTAPITPYLIAYFAGSTITTLLDFLWKLDIKRLLLAILKLWKS